MTATVKQLAEKLGLSQQTVRRYVKNEMKIQAEPRKTLYLTDEQAAQVAHHFTAEAPIPKAGTPTPKDETLKLYQELNNLKDQLHEKELEATRLRAKLDSQTETITLLQAELERLHEALAREQDSHIGFFNRLGQKLLGTGKD